MVWRHDLKTTTLTSNIEIEKKRESTRVSNINLVLLQTKLLQHDEQNTTIGKIHVLQQAGRQQHRHELLAFHQSSFKHVRIGQATVRASEPMRFAVDCGSGTGTGISPERVHAPCSFVACA